MDNGVWKSLVSIGCLCGHVRLIRCRLISPHVVVIVVVIAVDWGWVLEGLGVGGVSRTCILRWVSRKVAGGLWMRWMLRGD